MKERKNRLLLAFIILAMALLWVSVSSADIVAEGTAGAIGWKLEDNGTLTISGEATMLSNDRPWVDYKNRITNVVIESGVMSVGGNAFYDCMKIESVSIPDSVKEIGECAFYNCISLKSVVIPATVTIIKEQTFFNCESLKEVTFLGNVTEINRRAFMECESLENLFLPESLQTIGRQAFRSCSSLKYCTIPDNVTSIGSEAFAYCSGLQKIWISGADTAIDNTDSIQALYAIPTGTTVYCYANSPAWTWADGHGNNIVLLGDSIIQYIDASVPESILALSDRRTQIPYDYFPKVIDPHNVSWESSNDQVVIVSDTGKLVPKSLGEATVTLTVNGKTFQTAVTVKEPATSLSLPETITIERYQSVEIPLTIVPADAGVDLSYWTEEYVAYINEDGLLYGRYPGSTDLTIRDAYTGLEAKATVYVTTPPTPSSVTLDVNGAAMRVGQKIQLHATVTLSNNTTPVDGNRYVTFTSSDLSVAYVDESGLITGMGFGTAEISATTSNNCYARCYVDVREAETITIPAEDATISSYSFAGTRADKYIVQDKAERVTIEAYAFANLTDVLIILPENVKFIDDDAFARSSVTILTPEGSYAAGWAEEHGIPCILR